MINTDWDIHITYPLNKILRCRFPTGKHLSCQLMFNALIYLNMARTCCISYTLWYSLVLNAVGRLFVTISAGIESPST